MGEGVDERARRIAVNEAAFREVNERIKALMKSFESRSDRLDLICECGDGGCTSRIELDPEEYERLRTDSRTFAVAKGHDVPGVEEVVERRSGYDVVRKVAAEAERIADESDPRAD
jgi:hypothetical protein